MPDELERALRDFLDCPLSDREETLRRILGRIRDEIARHEVGPPMALLGCRVKNDYDERLYRVASVGQDPAYAGGGFAQLVSLDERTDFVDVDAVTLLRDYAVVPD